MQLTASQEKACDMMLDTAERFGGRMTFAGLAGTGKTTTLVEGVARLRQAGQRVAVCTPTGKAAHVINKKCPGIGATTLHRKLTVRPFDALEQLHRRLDELDALGEHKTPAEVEEEKKLIKDLDRRTAQGNNLFFEPKSAESVADEYDVLVFDEASMIGYDDTYLPLISHHRLPMIFVGDGGQLPPVNDKPAVDLINANVRLTEILRQEADSGILRFAHGLYNGKVMKARDIEKYADMQVLRDHGPKCINGFEDHQIIVWTNKERWAMNPQLRRYHGFNSAKEEFPFLPMVGEKVLCNTNCISSRLTKGEMLTVVDNSEYDPGSANKYLTRMRLVTEEGVERHLAISLCDMVPPSAKPFYASKDIDKKKRWSAQRNGIELRFPYTMTAHTAQGSEFDKVMLVGSMMPDSYKDWKQWWYTAATRAKNKLVVASYHFAHE